MYDRNQLETVIAQSGYKKSYLAEKLSMTKYTFSRKLSGASEFKASEIGLLSQILHLTPVKVEQIFYGRHVPNMAQ